MDLPETVQIHPTSVVRRTKIERVSHDLHTVTWTHAGGAMTFECANRDTARNLAAILDDPNVLRTV